MLLSGPDALREFRRLNTGRRLLSLIEEHKGRVRFDLPVGVGKSYMLDDIVEAAVREMAHDLVVVLMPTRKLIEERRWIVSPPPDVSIVNLKPRPAEDCDAEQNKAWKSYERRGLGTLGRETICKVCARYADCFWPQQYGAKLRGAQVVYASQKHLEVMPGFVDVLQAWAKANRVLVLIDEGNFLASPFRRVIPREALQLFVSVLEELVGEGEAGGLGAWLKTSSLLLNAATEDLRLPHWGLYPMPYGIALKVQEKGVEMHGDEFAFLAPAIRQLGGSLLDSRMRLPDGSIRFAAQPKIGHDFVFFSGTTSAEMVEHRLGFKLHDPFDGYRFNHPETRWFNLANRIGMACYFESNLPQILDFFTDLISRRLDEGKRPFLLSRQKFQDQCISGVEKRLAALGKGAYRVVKGDSPQFDPRDKHQIPIGHYGMIGINLFEDFGGVYCLNGYYISETAVNDSLQDVLAEDFHLEIGIQTTGDPPRRKAGVVDPGNRLYDVHALAQNALDDQEMGVVVQAAGRVRPFTKPREVFLFQCGGLPWGDYDFEFTSLEQARAYFELKGDRQKKKEDRRAQVQICKWQGLTQKEAAEQLGVSVRTVKRYWKGDANP